MKDLLYNPMFIDYMLGILKGLILPVTALVMALIIWKLNEVPFFNEIFKGAYRRFMKWKILENKKE